MKFWQKIFIYSLILFLIVFNIGGYFLIKNSYHLSMKREIDRGLSEHLSVYSGVRLIIKDRLLYEENFGEAYLHVAMKSYINSFNDKKIYLEILDEENDTVFSNLDIKIKGERIELENPLLDKRRYIIRDVEDQTYLFITNLLQVNDVYLKFTYVRDISYIDEEYKKQIYFFINLSMMVTFILGIIMYILSKVITKPINKLIDSTQKIAKGSFKERVNISSKDEIGILSENFNEMAASIEEKIKELEDIAKEKQRFINNLTHEIKTPLTSIIGYGEFLRRTKYKEEVFVKGLNHIVREGKRMEALSLKMMDLVFLKKENFEMKKENMKSIVLESKEALEMKLKNKNIKLIVSGENYDIYLERDLMKNLIMNVVDNAIKASFENSKIYIRIYINENSQKTMEIKDEGIGIEEEDIKKIMEPFYMVDKSRSRENNGAGLGLSICAEIARIHHATLNVESEIHKGTKISITFE